MFVSNTKQWTPQGAEGNTSNMKSHHPQPGSPRGRPGNVASWLRLGLSFALGCAATFAMGPSFSPRASGSNPRTVAMAEAPRQPLTLGQFLALSAAQRRAIDIARVNLLCANDLPGAEGLNIEKQLGTLDSWVKAVHLDTERHFYRFRENPGEYENSEPYYRMLALTTVIQQDFGVRYNPQRIRDPDFRDSRDLFIHGLLGEQHTGTCVSMPVLSVALGRRLGYPLKLALTKSHVFVRWDDGRSKPINFEATSKGLVMYADDFYANWPEPLTERDLATGAYLRSLTPEEELAVFLQARGNCLEDLGRLPEAQVAYAQAHFLGPKMPYALAFLAEAVRKEGDSSGLLVHRPLQRRSPGRDPREWQDLADRINAENAARLRGTGGPISPLPNPLSPTSIPIGGMP